MKYTFAIAVLMALFAGNLTRGHGLPINVSVEAGQLTASGGVNDPMGWASQMFINYGFDYFLEETSGAANLRTDVPGIDMIDIGMGLDQQAPNSQLWIEPLTRPFEGSATDPLRGLWYWSPSSREVELEPHETSLSLRARDYPAVTNRSLIQQAVTTSPIAIQIAAPLSSQANLHEHVLVHLIDNTPAVDLGVYAYFARVTSPNYSASEPFLVVLNHGVESDADLLAAALAINLAAADVSLSGDFNHDNIVDAADYTVWRDGLGTIFQQSDYDVWRANFGAVAPSAALAGVATVPEPTTRPMLLAIAMCLTRRRWWAPRSACRSRSHRKH